MDPTGPRREREEGPRQAFESSRGEREKLPDRRAGDVIQFEFPRGSWQLYSVTFSRFADGRPAELFLSVYGKGMSGSSLEAMARDSAILASIALQSGIGLATLIEATTAETNGTATSVIGCALRLIRDALDGGPDTPHSPPDAPALSGGRPDASAPSGAIVAVAA